MEDLLKDLGSKIDTIKENQGTTKEVIDTLKSEINTLKEKAISDEVTTRRLQDLSEEISQIKEVSMNAVNVSVKSVKDQVADFIKTNGEELSRIKSAGTGFLTLKFNFAGEESDEKDNRTVSKAVGTMTNGSATNVGVPTNLGVQIAPPSNANLRNIPILDVVNVINTGTSNFAYTEVTPKDGDSAYTAEGTAKTQIDFQTITRFATVYKPAAWEELTEEIVTDIPQIQSIAEDLLFRKHNLKKAKAILNGDGTGANPTGATVAARTFVAGSMALKVASPNIMDVVNACRTDIATTHNFQDETPYIANFVAMNPVDFYLELLSVKDGFGRPLYPEAQFQQSVTINGVMFMQDEAVATGKILVADMSKYNVSNYIPYSVRIGWINDNFITNKFCIVGESRHHAFIKNFDKKAFIYDTIATIKTAITKV